MIKNCLRTVPAACLVTLFLTACSGASPDSDSAASVGGSPTALPQRAGANTGQLASFAGEDICKILLPADIQRLFAPQAEVKTTPRISKRRAACSYVWPRPDAEERRKAMMAEMVRQMHPGGDATKLASRAFSTNYSISVSLRETRAGPGNFVPKKLSDTEIEARVQRVRKRAEKKLTDTQKQVVGAHGVERMAGDMLRAANERKVVEGVGDAAYWSSVGSGSLRVLVGHQELVIGVNVADDEAGNLQAAKNIYHAVMR
ncbi:MAG: hypothetical protein WB784_08590 [Rhodanobacteraceae bacterium]